MSMLRLLSAGKSLDGLQDSTARYRMGDPKAMPKFGSGNNPFWAKRQARGESREDHDCPLPPTLPAEAPALMGQRTQAKAVKGQEASLSPTEGEKAGLSSVVLLTKEGVRGQLSGTVEISPEARTLA